ncbi:hypothetical protein [Pyrobaculum sp.]|uniref:hypothetical protein n=1 Tax=Pyrobaculum sp. TaxID=2004705 RepID=UPI003D096864
MRAWEAGSDGGWGYDTPGIVLPRLDKHVFARGNQLYFILWRFTKATEEYESEIVVKQVDIARPLFTAERRRWGSAMLSINFFHVYDDFARIELRRGVRELWQRKERYPSFDYKPSGALVL